MVRCSRAESKVQGSSPTDLFIPTFFFSVFFVVVFCKYIAKLEIRESQNLAKLRGGEPIRGGRTGEK